VIRSILVCPDDFLWRLLADAGEKHFDALHVVEQPRARARIAQRGGAVLAGDLERDHAHLGARLELTGPWPPYNFVPGGGA
jgi:hypothetical protein